MSARRFFAEKYFVKRKIKSTKELCNESKRSNQGCPHIRDTEDVVAGMTAHVCHVWRNDFSSNSRE